MLSGQKTSMCQKKFDQKKILGQKNFGSKKSFGSKNFRVKKFFWSKKFVKNIICFFLKNWVKKIVW